MEPRTNTNERRNLATIEGNCRRRLYEEKRKNTSKALNNAENGQQYQKLMKD